MTEDFRIAIVVNPTLPFGLIANTAAAIGIGLAARLPVLAGQQLSDAQNRSIDISSRLPVPILQAEDEVIRALLLKALDTRTNAAVVPFPAFARSLHAYADYEATFPSRNLAEEAIDGLGLAGPAKWVKSLTGSLKLLR